jgi:hypothetical protein
MTIPQWVLLAFAGWTLAILFGTVGVYRWSKILSGQIRISAWRADQIQGCEWYRRAMRAHMNCVENLVVYGAIVLCATTAQVTGLLLNAASVVFLAARMLQSTTHIALEQTDRVTALRFGFFFAQVVCMVIMGIGVAWSAAENLRTGFQPF